MNKKYILIIELFLTFINNNLCGRCSKYTDFDKTSKDGPSTTSGLTCGKSHPKKQKDCTKYGTDSGMFCCWRALNENDNKGKCILISLKKIERSGIDGCAQFHDYYWSCGNFSSNIKINKILFGILLLGYFLLMR